MASAHSFDLNTLRALAQAYTDRRPGNAAVRVIASHIDAHGTPYGYLESEDAEAIRIIEAVAVVEAALEAA